MIASYFYGKHLYAKTEMIYNVEMMRKNDGPIGFYDSGVGGVSVLRETARLLPGEDFIYYGDNAHAPYGVKDEEEIKKLSLACGDFLYNAGAKMIVIACNTATSIVVKTMRENYNLPVISMEPAVKPACEKHKQGKIAVLATPATLRQKRYHALVERLGIGERVIDVHCSGLAELVELGRLDNPQIKACICEKLAPLRGEDVRALVIGCTHYSFISEQIGKVAGKLFKNKPELFDGLYGTARQVAAVLKEESLESGKNGRGSISFHSSDGEDAADLLNKFYTL